MSLAKVTKQLKRDLKASPAKAGALAVLVVVAVVFWGPLVFKQEEPTPKRPTAAAPTTPETTGPAAVRPGADVAVLGWRELSERLDREPRMQPYDVGAASPQDVSQRNPFEIETRAEREAAELEKLLDEAVELGMAADADVPAATAPTDASLADCPLVLTSTLVGPKSKAIINGMPYQRGRTIGTWNGKPLTLEVVAPRRAVIAWNGQTRELRIPAPGEASPTAPDSAAGASTQ